ncbi:contact-dependent growth inhibition system immunity protein [Photorhabdus heterorhabditis]|uniref:contact-dependent growth inhibition system immunity protein n=1 Tax=Photorhabdus heterorhabditis TaxID=880156 RepID=UPI001562470D|nr:contact-dependent growth inhibition system immunity protein [Photorhabdus heterorhabditis]NRN30891.1 CdiI family contact-dependent growth inhibition immunity protein [Photorhabdus heterorhabditis subsp. aluminescens]
MNKHPDQGLNAGAKFNGDFYSIQTHSGNGLLGVDPLGSKHLLQPFVSDQELGNAVFDALSKSRVIPIDECGDYFDHDVNDKQYKNWITEMMGSYGYRSKRQLFRKMNNCDICLLDGVITIMPYGHEKLELWTGQGIVESDYVIIPADSSPAEVGAALRLAFSRCRSYV